MKPHIAFVIFILIAFAACKKSNNASKIPKISFLGMQPDSVQSGSPTDTVFIAFSFSDGDADLGNNPNDTIYDVYLRDSRYDTPGSTFTGYFFPPIDQTIENPDNGISGTAVFKQLAAFLLPRQDSNHIKNGDTLYFELYIRDRAGHNSDTIKTTNLYLLP